MMKNDRYPTENVRRLSMAQAKIELRSRQRTSEPRTKRRLKLGSPFLSISRVSVFINDVQPKSAPVERLGDKMESSHMLPKTCDACRDRRYVYFDWLSLERRPPPPGV
eukprot:5818289-Pleurochrysis_carterae.AAC.2